MSQNFIFMHDDLKHTAGVYKDYLRHLEQNDQSKIMHWPPLNPIEKICNEFDRKIREACLKSPNDLWKKL